MKYYQTFKITGSAYFPFDMLRYDSCWPALESEMCLINDTDSTRTITIARRVDAKVLPTIARWHSFGWEVSTIETRRI
jgi:hypothetical protein